MKNVMVWIWWDGLLACIPLVTMMVLVKDWMIQQAWQPERFQGRTR